MSTPYAYSSTRCHELCRFSFTFWIHSCSHFIVTVREALFIYIDYFFRSFPSLAGTQKYLLAAAPYVYLSARFHKTTRWMSFIFAVSLHSLYTLCIHVFPSFSWNSISISSFIDTLKALHLWGMSQFWLAPTRSWACHYLDVNIIVHVWIIFPPTSVCYF